VLARGLPYPHRVRQRKGSPNFALPDETVADGPRPYSHHLPKVPMSKATLIVPVLAACILLLATHPAPGQSSPTRLATTDTVETSPTLIKSSFFVSHSKLTCSAGKRFCFIDFSSALTRSVDGMDGDRPHLGPTSVASSIYKNRAKNIHGRTGLI
jgi:hypothetical protein